MSYLGEVKTVDMMVSMDSVPDQPKKDGDAMENSVSVIEVPKDHGSPSTGGYIIKQIERIAAVSTYCVSSISTFLLQRHIFGIHGFKMNALLMLTQSLFVTGVLIILFLSKKLDFHKISLEEALYWVPVAGAFVAMTYSGSQCLANFSAPIVSIFKNSNIIFVSIGDRILFAKKFNLLAYISLLFMVMSPIVSFFTDNESRFRLEAMPWLFLNLFSVSAFVLIMKVRMRKLNFQNFDCVFYNNLIAIPIFTILSVCLDDWAAFLTREGNTFFNPGSELLGVWIFLGCLSAFGINLGTAWVIKLLSATAYSILSSLTKLPATISGMFFFPKDADFSTGSIVSIAFSFISGMLYSISQMPTCNRSKHRQSPSFDEQATHHTTSSTDGIHVIPVNSFDDKTAVISVETPKQDDYFQTDLSPTRNILDKV